MVSHDKIAHESYTQEMFTDTYCEKEAISNKIITLSKRAILKLLMKNDSCLEIKLDRSDCQRLGQLLRNTSKWRFSYHTKFEPRRVMHTGRQRVFNPDCYDLLLHGLLQLFMFSFHVISRDFVNWRTTKCKKLLIPAHAL